MADSSQVTQGGSKLRRSCQSTIVGAACTEQYRNIFFINIKVQTKIYNILKFFTVNFVLMSLLKV